MNKGKFYINKTSFEYPDAYKKIVDLGLVDFDNWFLMEKKQATGIYEGMKERYPERDLLPFAKKSDNDDTACFEAGKNNRVQIIHNFASAGWEQRAEFEDIWEWLESAVKDMIDFNREEN